MWLYYDKNVEGASHHTFQVFSGYLQVIFIELAENVIAINCMFLSCHVRVSEWIHTL